MSGETVFPALREGWKLVRKDRTPLAAAVCLILLNRAGAMALPVSSKFLIDDVIGRQHLKLLVPLAAVSAIAILTEAGTGFLLYRLVGVTSQRAITRLRQGVHRHMLRLPVGFFDEARTGALVSRIMTDPETVRDVLGHGLVQVASGVLTALVALAILFTINPLVTSAVIVVLTGSLVFLTRGFGRLYPAFLKIGERTAEVTGRLAEVLGGIWVVKTSMAERREAHAFTRESHRLLREYSSAFTGAAGLLAASTLTVGVVNGIVLIVGGRAVAAGGMTLGDFVMYAFFANVLSIPLLQLAATGSQLGSAIASLGRTAELHAVATEDDQDSGLAPLPAVRGAVVFDQVSFAYLPGRPVLRGVSFDIPAGATVAIVGPNGAGKTTIAQLLLRFRRPIGGRVLVDGQDIALVRARDYRAHVGFVPHDAVLFDGSIIDNIRYGSPNASFSDVRQAARLACCEEFVAQLPEGYDTHIGEHGRRLSGGERQRLAIARAILGDPRILVLDEATAHLDSEAELLLRDTMRSVRRRRTVLVIAHRFSTIREADLVLMIDGGVLLERGTHEELLARRGRYWRLYEAHEHREPADRAGQPDARGRVA